jgi:hypothetical protein
MAEFGAHSFRNIAATSASVWPSDPPHDPPRHDPPRVTRLGIIALLVDAHMLAVEQITQFRQIIRASS